MKLGVWQAEPIPLVLRQWVRVRVRAMARAREHLDNTGVHIVHHVVTNQLLVLMLPVLYLTTLSVGILAAMRRLPFH